jgi:transcriptional regulator with PAS, ATPase and Fis domain
MTTSRDENPRLLVGASGDARREHPLASDTVVGRDASCDIVIPDDSVSRRHALLRAETDGTWILIDLGSANGTYREGAPLGLPIALRDGDRLRFGDAEAEFHGPDEGESTGESYPRVTTGHRTRTAGLQDAARIQFLGVSPAILSVLSLARKAANSDIPVHIAGETGTGKDLLARAIHEEGARAGRPLIPVNCAALPEALLESSLFGHTRGAFTGAFQAREGLLRAADGGSVFLDEIGEMPPAMQTKLLRFLQEGEVLRVGESRPSRVDVRILSATNRDLAGDVEEGRFRRDVYYRLCGFTIALPPLRERPGDVPLLTERLLGTACARHRKRVRLEPAVLRIFERYTWPGNVRELENELLRCVAVAADGGVITPQDLPAHLRDEPGSRDDTASGRDRNGADLRAAVADFERRHIIAALEANRGNVSRTARELGLSRSAMYKKLKEYGLRPNGDT